MVEVQADNMSHSDTTLQPGHPTEQLEIEADSHAAEAEDETRYPKGKKLAAVLAALVILNATIGLDVAIVAVTVPSLSDEFKTLADIGWYSTALRLVLCSFLLLFGKAYTVFHTKSLFVLSISMYELGNAMCTFAPTSKVFIIGRAISGFGCAGTVGGMFAVMTQSFPLRRRPFIGGLLGGVETFACLSAPLIGGALIDGWTWRACYGINVPLGLAGLLVIAIYLDVPPNPDFNLPWRQKVKKLDVFGTAVFVPGMTCFLLALQWGGTTYGWGNSRVIATFIVFGVLMALFVWTQYRYQENATLPARILRNRSIIAGTWFVACANATIALIEYYMSIYFQGVRGYSAVRSGLYALPMIVGMCVAVISFGAATSWIGYYVPFMYFTTILSPIAAGLLTTINLETDLVKVLCLLGLLGFATGGSLQMPQIAAQTVLSPQDVLTGYSIVQFGSQMGPVIFLSASATLFANRLRSEVQDYSPTTNVTSLENMGLSDIRKSLGGDRLGDVLLGYDAAVVQTLYLPLALSCMTIFGSLAMEWRSVKKKQS
jgi:MFS family permease